jgi:hypothetical protein
MPAEATNPGVNIRDQDSARLRPAFTERLLTQSESIRQDTSFAQKYRMDFHACRFRETENAGSPPVEAASGIEGEETLEEGCPGAPSPEEAGVGLAAAAGSAGAAGRLPSPTFPSLMARRAAKCFSTSTFLMRLIFAPVVLLLA